MTISATCLPVSVALVGVMAIEAFFVSHRGPGLNGENTGEGNGNDKSTQADTEVE